MRSAASARTSSFSSRDLLGESAGAPVGPSAAWEPWAGSWQGLQGEGKVQSAARNGSARPSRSILPPSPRRARSVSRVTPPLASSSARPATCATAARSCAASMLSSSSRGAPAASASSISCGLRTSTSSVPASSGAASRARATACGDPAGGRDVVLLDQDRVVEARAVVDRAAGRHGRLLERPQARRGLARVEHPRAGALAPRAPRARPSWPRRRGARGSSAPCARRSAARARRPPPPAPGRRPRARRPPREALACARSGRAARTPPRPRPARRSRRAPSG